MGFFSFKTAKHLYPPLFSCTVQTSRLWPWLPAWTWRIQSLQPFFDTDNSRKDAATRIGIQKKGGGWRSDYSRASLHAKEEFKNNTNFCWNVPMESVGSLTITIINWGVVQKQGIWVRKKEWTKYYSFYFQVYAIYTETQNCSLLSICQLVLVITLPNCARVPGDFVSGLSKSVSPSKYVYFAFWT